ARRVDLVPLPLGDDVPAYHLPNLLVRRLAAEQTLHVGLVDGEQAVAHLAVGREPDAVAAEAERPRDRGDDADAAAIVGIAELHCWRARVVVVYRHQGRDLLQLLQDFVGAVDLAALP